jgi:GAF domain-containing protein
MNWHDPGFHPDDVEVKVAELLVATADEADTLIDNSVPEVLRLLREKMKMDVVFVSEFTDGKRVFRYVDQTPGKEVIAAGGADPLEESWCQRVVDGRLPQLIADAAPLQAADPSLATPFPIGTHLSAPIVLGTGQIYGTLCCFSFGRNPQITERDLNKLRYTAELTARKIETSRQKDVALALEPVQDKGFKGRL